MDGGYLYLDEQERERNRALVEAAAIRLCLGSDEFISGKRKYCLWLNEVSEEILDDAVHFESIGQGGIDTE